MLFFMCIILCRVSSAWEHLLWLFPQWRIWFPFAPPTQCFQIASEGQGSLLSSRQMGLGVQELYIAPPWRCALTSTHTNAHAGFGTNKWKKKVAALHPPSFASPQFFNNFQSRVSSVPESDAASNFSAVLLPTVSSSLTPAGTGTGPTPTSQMRSPREAASQPLWAHSGTIIWLSGNPRE